MTVYSVFDPIFSSYGRVMAGYEAECKVIADTLAVSTPLPEGVDYVPEEPALQSLPESAVLGMALFGGIPFQMGWCNGSNTKLNCLEYHRSSEFNLGVDDFILLLAKQDELENGTLDTEKVRAFCVPARVLVEIYATTLHYAPCDAEKGQGFKVLVALPKGTNTDQLDKAAKGGDSVYLWACNKWLLAHRESAEAVQGAQMALVGENIDIMKDL